MELLGAERDFNIGTNPGWWSAWALSKASRDISVIYWGYKPLGKILADRIGSDKYFHWDFRRG